MHFISRKIGVNLTDYADFKGFSIVDSYSTLRRGGFQTINDRVVDQVPDRDK